jgi:hypothetical protein
MKIFKTILFLAVMIFSANSFGQNDCDNATQLNYYNINEDYYMDGNEYWISFAPSEKYFKAYLYPTIQQTAVNISKITLYDGNTDCNNLQFITEILPSANLDSILINFNLNAGYIYYLKIESTKENNGYFTLNCSDIEPNPIEIQCSSSGLPIINPNDQFYEDNLTNELISAITNQTNLYYDPLSILYTDEYSNGCNWIGWKHTPQIKKENVEEYNNYYLHLWASFNLVEENYYEEFEAAYNIISGATVPNGISLYQDSTYNLTFKLRPKGISNLDIYLIDKNTYDTLILPPSQNQGQLIDNIYLGEYVSDTWLNYNTNFICNNSSYNSILFVPHKITENTSVEGYNYTYTDIDDVQLKMPTPTYINLTNSNVEGCDGIVTFSVINPDINSTWTWKFPIGVTFPQGVTGLVTTLPWAIIVTNSTSSITISWHSAGTYNVTAEGSITNLSQYGYWGSIYYNPDPNSDCFPNALTFNNKKASDIISHFANTTINILNPIKFEGTIIIDQNITFDGCPLMYFFNFAKMIVMPGKTLTIKNSTLQGCFCPWDGLYAEDPTANIILLNNTIRDANNAVVSNNKGYININNVVFENNLTSIIIKNYNPPFLYDIYGNPGLPSSHNAYIIKSTFKSNPSIPSAINFAFNYLYGIKIDNAYDVTIGDDAFQYYKNSFERLLYSIDITNSNANIYNNQFDNSTFPNYGIPQYNTGTTINEPEAAAIVARSYYNTFQLEMPINCKINIGGLNYKSNSFNHFNIGIFSYNNITDIKNNLFTNQKFIGIHLYEPKLNTNITNNIQNNNINMFDNITWPSSNTLFNSSILVERITTNSFVNLDITYNTISNARTGIHLRNCNGAGSGNNHCLVDVNSINFGTLSTTIGHNYFGIKAEHCNYSKIQNNNIVYNTEPIASLQAKLQGIYLDLTENASIGLNRMNYMGNGMNVNNSNLNTQFFCNDFDQCWNGFYFNNANLSNQLLFAPPNGNITSDNYWYDIPPVNNTTALRRMEGSSSNLSAIQWLHRDFTLTFFNIYSPYIIDNTDPLFYKISCIQSQIPNPVCMSWFVFSSSIGRALLLENIVNDTNTYTGLQQANDYMAKEFAYKKLDESPAYLSMNSVEDIKYNLFYNKHKIKNIGKFDKVSKHIRNQNYQAALAINNSIIDENQIETNRKTVNRIYLENLMNNIKVNTFDSLELVNIAWQESKFGGNAVFTARVMLGIDPDLNSISYAAPFKHLSETKYENLVTIYPNPATELINISFNNETENEYIFELYDINGKIIVNKVIQPKNINFSINLNSVKAGLYYYKIVSQNETLFKDKLIILNK